MRWPIFLFHIFYLKLIKDHLCQKSKISWMFFAVSWTSLINIVKPCKKYCWTHNWMYYTTLSKYYIPELQSAPQKPERQGVQAAVTWSQAISRHFSEQPDEKIPLNSYSVIMRSFWEYLKCSTVFIFFSS